MPVIELHTVSRPTREQKAQIVKEFTDTLVKVLGSSPAKTHIIFDEKSTDDWGNEGILVSERKN